MPGRSKPAKDVDAYIAGFPKDVQKILQQVRATILEALPGAEETISYQIPTFKLRGRPVVYFAGFKNHVSVYPAPVGDPAFKGNFSAYASGKGTAKFPLDEPLPLDLIREIAKFRAKTRAS